VTATTTEAVAPAAPRSPARWWPPVLIVAVAIVVRIGALVVHKHLSLDDGAYGVSIADMRHGLAPYRDLFASQGPLHYPLLYLGDLLSGHARNGPRVVPVLSGIVAPIATWATARRLGSTRNVALIAGLLVATTGSMLWVTGPVSADGPAVAFTACAVWAAVVFRDRPAIGFAVLAGVLFGAALATKPLIAPAAVPIAWWLWRRHRVTDELAAAVAAIVVWFATAVPWGLGRVWSQSIAFHTEKEAQSPPWTQFGKLVTTLANRDLVLVAAVALGLVAVYAFHRAVAPIRPGDVRVVLVWMALTVVVLVFEKLLLVSHIATLVLPLALLFAMRPPPLRWLAIALIVLVPVQLYQLSNIFWPGPYNNDAARVEAALRALPPGTRAIADITGLVWQAGRITPRLLNDSSHARIAAGRLTTDMVIAGAEQPDTCAVVIWSFRFGQDLHDLRDRLQQAGYERKLDFTPNHQLWVKNSPECRTS
jgi:hypothetical protein